MTPEELEAFKAKDVEYFAERLQALLDIGFEADIGLDEEESPFPEGLGMPGEKDSLPPPPPPKPIEKPEPKKELPKKPEAPKPPPKPEGMNPPGEEVPKGPVLPPIGNAQTSGTEM